MTTPNNNKRSWIPGYLRQRASALGSPIGSPFRRLMGSRPATPSRQTQDTTVDEVASWMSSIKRRAVSALQHDDEMEDELESELSYARQQREKEAEESTDAFDKLGNILYHLFEESKSAKDTRDSEERDSAQDEALPTNGARDTADVPSENVDGELEAQVYEADGMPQEDEDDSQESDLVVLSSDGEGDEDHGHGDGDSLEESHQEAEYEEDSQEEESAEHRGHDQYSDDDSIAPSLSQNYMRVPQDRPTVHYERDYEDDGHEERVSSEEGSFDEPDVEEISDEAEGESDGEIESQSPDHEQEGLLHESYEEDYAEEDDGLPVQAGISQDLDADIDTFPPVSQPEVANSGSGSLAMHYVISEDEGEDEGEDEDEEDEHEQEADKGVNKEVDDQLGEAMEEDVDMDEDVDADMDDDLVIAAEHAHEPGIYGHELGEQVGLSDAVVHNASAEAIALEALSQFNQVQVAAVDMTADHDDAHELPLAAFGSATVGEPEENVTPDYGQEVVELIDSDEDMLDVAPVEAPTAGVSTQPAAVEDVAEGFADHAAEAHLPKTTTITAAADDDNIISYQERPNAEENRGEISAVSPPETLSSKRVDELAQGAERTHFQAAPDLFSLVETKQKPIVSLSSVNPFVSLSQNQEVRKPEFKPADINFSFGSFDKVTEPKPSVAAPMAKSSAREEGPKVAVPVEDSSDVREPAVPAAESSSKQPEEPRVNTTVKPPQSFSPSFSLGFDFGTFLGSDSPGAPLDRPVSVAQKLSFGRNISAADTKRLASTALSLFRQSPLFSGRPNLPSRPTTPLPPQRPRNSGSRFSSPTINLSLPKDAFTFPSPTLPREESNESKKTEAELSGNTEMQHEASEGSSKSESAAATPIADKPASSKTRPAKRKGGSTTDKPVEEVASTDSPADVLQKNKEQDSAIQGDDATVVPKSPVERASRTLKPASPSTKGRDRSASPSNVASRARMLRSGRIFDEGTGETLILDHDELEAFEERRASPSPELFEQAHEHRQEAVDVGVADSLRSVEPSRESGPSGKRNQSSKRRSRDAVKADEPSPSNEDKSPKRRTRSRGEVKAAVSDENLAPADSTGSPRRRQRRAQTTDTSNEAPDTEENSAQTEAVIDAAQQVPLQESPRRRGRSRRTDTIAEAADNSAETNTDGDAVQESPGRRGRSQQMDTVEDVGAGDSARDASDNRTRAKGDASIQESPRRRGRSRRVDTATADDSSAIDGSGDKRRSRRLRGQHDSSTSSEQPEEAPAAKLEVDSTPTKRRAATHKRQRSEASSKVEETKQKRVRFIGSEDDKMEEDEPEQVVQADPAEDTAVPAPAEEEPGDATPENSPKKSKGKKRKAEAPSSTPIAKRRPRRINVNKKS